MAAGDDNPTDKYGQPRSGQMVCDPATGQGGQVNSHRVPAVNRRRLLGVKAEPAQGNGRGHVEDENGAHAVITETLPEFDEKERAEAFWVSGKSGAVSGLCVHNWAGIYPGSENFATKRHKRPKNIF